MKCQQNLELIRYAKRDGIDAALASMAKPRDAKPAGLPQEVVVTAANNTFAVLTAAHDRTTEWRSELTRLCNATTAAGDELNTAFFGALIDLIDADGTAENIHPTLSGLQEEAWELLVAALQQFRSTENSKNDTSEET